MSRPRQWWAVSPWDCQAHLLLRDGDHPQGLLRARCAVLLPVTAAVLDHRPSGSICFPCELIARADLDYSPCLDVVQAGLDRVAATLRRLAQSDGPHGDPPATRRVDPDRPSVEPEACPVRTSLPPVQELPAAGRFHNYTEVVDLAVTTRGNALGEDWARAHSELAFS